GKDGLFGPCEGERTPTEEMCGNSLDDDCNGKVDDGCPCIAGKSYACYSGKESTKNVGNCKAGTQVCKKDGESFGPCMGEVKPTAEDFEQDGDEDCDGVPSAETLWVTIFEPSEGGQVYASRVVVDKSGNLFVAGHFTGTMKVGNKTATSAGGSVFLAKF